jgi:hypothetical protein
MIGSLHGDVGALQTFHDWRPVEFQSQIHGRWESLDQLAHRFANLMQCFDGHLLGAIGADDDRAPAELIDELGVADMQQVVSLSLGLFENNQVRLEAADALELSIGQQLLQIGDGFALLLHPFFDEAKKEFDAVKTGSRISFEHFLDGLVGCRDGIDGDLFLLHFG